MGRNPKPVELRLIEGNPGKRKLPTDRLQSGACPVEPPDFLNDDAKDEWRRVHALLTPAGILQATDWGSLAAVADAYGRWATFSRKFEAMAEADPVSGGAMVPTSKGGVMQNPLLGALNKARSDYVRFCAEFGLTPVARVKAPAGQAAPKSKFEGLLGGKSA